MITKIIDAIDIVAYQVPVFVHGVGLFNMTYPGKPFDMLRAAPSQLLRINTQWVLESIIPYNLSLKEVYYEAQEICRMLRR